MSPLDVYRDAGHVVDLVSRRRCGLKAALYGKQQRNLAVLRALVPRVLALAPHLRPAISGGTVSSPADGVGARKDDTKASRKRTREGDDVARKTSVGSPYGSSLSSAPVSGFQLCLCVEMLRCGEEGTKFKPGGRDVTPLKRRIAEIRARLAEVLGEARLREMLLDSSENQLSSKDGGPGHSSDADGVAGGVPEYCFLRVNPRKIRDAVCELLSTSKEASSETLLVDVELESDAATTLKNVARVTAIAERKFLAEKLRTSVKTTDREKNDNAKSTAKPDRKSTSSTSSRNLIAGSDKAGQKKENGDAALPFEQDPLVPFCWRIPKREWYARLVHPLAEAGDVIVQDRSSQFSGLAAAEKIIRHLQMTETSRIEGATGDEKTTTKGGCKLVDACASPGSKTSHLVHMLQLLDLFDFSRRAQARPASDNAEGRLGLSCTSNRTPKKKIHTVVAVEKNPARFLTLLQRMMTVCGPLFLERSTVAGEDGDEPAVSDSPFELPKNVDFGKAAMNKGKSRGKGGKAAVGKGKGKKSGGAGKQDMLRDDEQVRPRYSFRVGTSEASVRLVLRQCDFFDLDINQDPDFAYTNILVLDPSCSGSGLAEHVADNVAVFEKQPESVLLRSTETKSSQEVRTGCGEKDALDSSSSRVESLAQFQTRLLEHGLAAFSTALETVLYSTCSIFDRENEHVVRDALASASSKKSWKAVPALPFAWPEIRKTEAESRQKKLVDSDKSIIKTAEERQNLEDLLLLCAHSLPKEHKCRGFFLARIDRMKETSNDQEGSSRAAAVPPTSTRELPEPENNSITVEDAPPSKKRRKQLMRDLREALRKSDKS
ncbi:unnamed protein product [Amoebophrya sp. A25]|nr:unnamed protein product [Amoebophrya sp. A25]|eukprot:GSA25T00018957001.1